ncbi:hypothetical protein V1512DRAFT_218706 [Lipomyces arxii]|uniref:uncharacterized protein n=1 Tax=Lipomyces arxii TaxID=56418 RepID=UPI0034CEFDB1
MRRFFGLSDPEEEVRRSRQNHHNHHNHHKHSDGSSKPDHVLVKHNKQFLRIDFDKPGDVERGVATVGDVRATTARHLGQSKDTVSLVFGGKKLLDDKQTLKAANVKSGARMLCLTAAHNTHAVPHPPVAKPAKPVDPIERIDMILNEAAKQLVPLIEEFEIKTPEEQSAKFDRHRMLSELILQKLFSLDEVDTHENPTARQHRKDAVNKLHEYQARVDKIFPPQPTSSQ